MNAIQTLIELNHFPFAFAAIFFAALFATLHLSFRDAGEAGTARLIKKYPKLAKKLEHAPARWPYWTLSLLIPAFIFEIIGASLALLGCVTWIDQSWAMATLVAIGLIALFAVAVRILPQALSEAYADRITALSLGPARFLAILLAPLVWPWIWLEKRMFLQLMKAAPESGRPSPEDEIRSLVDQAHEEELDLEEEERDIIRSVFRFGETDAGEIMTPRVNIVGLEDNLSIKECINAIKDSAHSRFPVYHDRIDKIVGIVHVKDLLLKISRNEEAEPITTILKEPPFVPESMPINDLLSMLQSDKAQLAIVVDEYGGTAGLVTIEDIIEELVGDIQDEYDKEEAQVQRLSEDTFVIDASMPVDEANDILEIQVPESEEYDSVGGYILAILGHIPAPGETLETDQLTFTIQTANSHQLHKIRVQKKVPA